MKRVLAFTGGRNVASGRFRVEQYTSPLRKFGVSMDVACSRFGAYPPPIRALRPAWAVASALSRLPSVVRSRSFDAVLLQRPLLSTLHTFEDFTMRPRILDVDDAIWLAPRGENVGRIASRCDRVIAGNAFLAEYFARHCHDVVTIPTAVDTNRFTPINRDRSHVIVGWSGCRSGSSELTAIAPALSRVCRTRQQVRIRIMADVPPDLPGVDPDRVEFVTWSADRESATIQSFDIGLMPLAEGAWQRGKCSYKMLLSMSCGSAVAVSPVGMNREVLAMGDIGRAASTLDQWTDALIDLVDSTQARQQLGARGRTVIEERFSVDAIVPQLAAAIAGLN